MANVVATSTSGVWCCPKCQEINSWYNKECKNESCQYPIHPCPICTLNNTYIATKCEICFQNIPPVVINTPSKSSIPSLIPITNTTNTDKISLKTAETEILLSSSQDTQSDAEPTYKLNPQLTSNANFTNKENESIVANTNTNKKRRLNNKKDNTAMPKRKKRKINSQNNSHQKRKPSIKKTKTNCKSRKKSREQKSAQNENNSNSKDEKEDIEMKDNINDFEIIDPKILSKEVYKAITDAYNRFLKYYSTGEYALRTLCIEFGPKFTGKSKEFTKILSDVEWRPQSLKLPTNVAFKSTTNNSLPDFVCRIKYHTIFQHEPDLIYSSGNAPNIVQKLQELDMDGLAEYFIPRLTSENDFVYFSWVMIRLNWKAFKGLFQNNEFDEMIERVKQMNGVNSVCIVLEGIKTKITSIQKSRMENAVAPDPDTGFKDPYCPFGTTQQFVDKMTSYYFKDKGIHSYCSVNGKKTAEYLIRAARSLAENRFKSGLTLNISVSEENKKNLFGVMLEAQIAGVSDKKATAIVTKYPTPGAMIAVYRKFSNDEDGEKLLEDIELNYRNDNSNSNYVRTSRIGALISKKIYYEWYGNINDTA